MKSTPESRCTPLYAVIDLGSNSFHMLIARLVADGVQVVDKVKRKVRLASGLNENNQLSNAAIARGLECLSFFAERLQDIPKENIRVVATATLRIAQNAEQFLSKASEILDHDVQLLSGQQEAEQIYLGVAHTNCCADQRLVLDIGGASTELVIGYGFVPQKVTSLDIGCVTYLKRYFGDQQLNEQNFTTAIEAATATLAQVCRDYQQIGWQSVLGGSGTMQALGEMLMAENRPAIIDADYLQQIKQKLIACQSIENIALNGLPSERKPVLASGLAILIALFNCLGIKQLQLSSGAIREGLLYEMLPNMRAKTIRSRTINALTERFHIDQHHANRVAEQASNLFKQVAMQWQLSEDNSFQLLLTSCALHEIGLLLEYKYHQQHGAYILQQADLPGFDQSDRQLLVAFVRHYKADIDKNRLLQQSAVSYQTSCKLLILMRLAVILCRRRQDDVLPDYQLTTEQHLLTLALPADWLNRHPLIYDELITENQFIDSLGYQLTVIAVE